MITSTKYITGTRSYSELCSAAESLLDAKTLDECSLRLDLCPNGRCIDTDSGYECECLDGFKADGSGQCVDADECAEGKCRGGTCRNTEGSFVCQCPKGFHLAGIVRIFGSSWAGFIIIMPFQKQKGLRVFNFVWVNTSTAIIEQFQ